MSDPLEDELRVQRARFELRSMLESLLMEYGQEYASRQNLGRLFDIYRSYAVSFIERLRAIGLSPSIDVALAEVREACQRVRPSHPELIYHDEFQSSMAAALTKALFAKTEDEPLKRLRSSPPSDSIRQSSESENDPTISPEVKSDTQDQVHSFARQVSWASLQLEFLGHAADHNELAAVCRWRYPGSVITEALANILVAGPNFTPGDPLRQIYSRPDPTRRPPAPKREWTFTGGNPASQHLFRVVASKAAEALPKPSGVEQWQVWLDFMRTEGYGSELPAISQSGVNLGKYPDGYEDQQIEHVFRVSADCCFVRSLAAPSPPEAPARELNEDDSSGGSSLPDIAQPLFRRGATEHSYLHACWTASTTQWSFHEFLADAQGNPDYLHPVAAGEQAIGLLKEATRIAVRRLRCSASREVRGAVDTLREPVLVWLDLMRAHERGFRPIPQLRNWRGGKYIEDFEETGAIPTDVRITGNGTIMKLFEESAAFWEDLLSFELMPSAPAKTTAGCADFEQSSSPSDAGAGKALISAQSAILAEAGNDVQLARDPNVDLLDKVVAKKQITIETWAADHRFGRTTIFDWKAGRSAGIPLKGKVSEKTAKAIEAAIRVDATELGLDTD